MQPTQEVTVVPTQKSLLSKIGTTAIFLWIPYMLFTFLVIGLISSGGGNAAKIYNEYGSYLFFFNIILFGLSFFAYYNRNKASLLSVIPLLLLVVSFYAFIQFDQIDDKINNRTHLQEASTPTETRFICQGTHKNAYITADESGAYVFLSVGNTSSIGEIKGKYLLVDSLLPRETVNILFTECFNVDNQTVPQVYTIQ